MRTVFLALLAVAWFSGCAASGLGTGHVGLRAAATTGVQARLTEEGLFGPDVSIRRVENGYRGTSLDRVVDLDLRQPDKVAGIYGSGPVSLTWAPDDGGLRIRGLFGGQISNLLISDKKIAGTLGDCTYQMEGEGHLYRGFQRCRSITQRDSVLEVPSILDTQALNERVAVLSLVLATYRPVADPVTLSDMAPPLPPRHWRNVNGVYQNRTP